MKTTTNINGNVHSGVVTLTRREIVRRLEQGAQQRCGVSAQVLLRNYRSGKIDRSTVADLLALSNLLRENDPIFAE
jgi:hypothetical protein